MRIMAETFTTSTVFVLLSLFIIVLPHPSTAETSSQINVSIGYGPQNIDRQNNSIIDFNYNFYRYQFQNSDKLTFLNNLTSQFGVGYSYLCTDADVNKDLHLFSLNPSIQYTLPELKLKHSFFQPFINIGIGPSIMSSKSLGYQQQGSRFIFNDFFGIGVRFGKDCKWELSLLWRHLSNGGFLSSPNPGFDVPFSLTLGRRF